MLWSDIASSNEVLASFEELSRISSVQSRLGAPDSTDESSASESDWPNEASSSDRGVALEREPFSKCEYSCMGKELLSLLRSVSSRGRPRGVSFSGSSSVQLSVDSSSSSAVTATDCLPSPLWVSSASVAPPLFFEGAISIILCDSPASDSAALASDLSSTAGSVLPTLLIASSSSIPL